MTDYLKGREINDGIALARENVNISLTNNSDYGRVFYDFYSRYIINGNDKNNTSGKKTTLIIVGDAKNNWRPGEKWCFKSTRHAKFLLNYHFVWIPKYRKSILDNSEIKEIISDTIKELSEKHKFDILALEIMPDHFVATAGNVSSETIRHYIDKQG